MASPPHPSPWSSLCYQNAIMSTVREEKTQFLSLREHSRELQSGRSMSRGCVPPARPKYGVIACSWDGLPARPGVLLPVPACTCRWSDWPRPSLKGRTAQRPFGLVLTQGLLSGKGVFILCVPTRGTRGHTKPRGSGTLPSAKRGPAASRPSEHWGARTARGNSVPQRTRSAMRDVTGREDSGELPTSRGFRENQQEP